MHTQPAQLPKQKKNGSDKEVVWHHILLCPPLLHYIIAPIFMLEIYFTCNVLKVAWTVALAKFSKKINSTINS